MANPFTGGYELIEHDVSSTPERPITAYFLTDKFGGREKRFAAPVTPDAAEWESWRRGLRAKLRELLAIEAWGMPTTPDYTVIEERETPTYLQRKIAYESVPGNWVSAFLLLPKRPASTGGAVVCPHGHFKGGKLSVVDAAHGAGKAYGHELASRGLVVLAPDNAGMGERDIDEAEVTGEHKGGCDLLFRRLNHVGLDLTGLRVFELMVGVSLLESIEGVDRRRIGCAGLSGGCWLSQVLAALDGRIAAVILSGYFTTFAQTAWIGHCVCHHPHAIGVYCEMPDISSLIAPRPQFIESGKDDHAYPLEPALSLVRRSYRLLGVEERLSVDSFDGGHQFHGDLSIPWMTAQLGGEPEETGR